MGVGRWARLALLLTCCVAAVPGTVLTGRGQSTPAAAPGSGTIVGTTGANLRECPEADCPVRAVALLGERVAIAGEMVDGFVPVVWGGVEGWVWNLYLATPERGTPELRRGEPGCDRVALIFNIGVGDETRLPILEYLRRERVAATLFPMGWWTEENPELLKRMDAMGFPIGSHGNTRGELTLRGDGEVGEDVRRSFALIERVIGEEPERYFTPYAAEMDERVRDMVAKQGYLPVAWEVPAADYGPEATADSVYMRVVPNVYDGAIVEFHLDAPASARSTEIAVPWIVEKLREKGYRFVTIPEMAGPCDVDEADGPGVETDSD